VPFALATSRSWSRPRADRRVAFTAGAGRIGAATAAGGGNHGGQDGDQGKTLSGHSIRGQCCLVCVDRLLWQASATSGPKRFGKSSEPLLHLDAWATEAAFWTVGSVALSGHGRSCSLSSRRRWNETAGSMSFQEAR